MLDDITTSLPVGTTGVPATDVFRAIAATCRPRTFEVSITAWDQLSWPAACDSASWGWCGRSQTPAACHSRAEARILRPHLAGGWVEQMRARRQLAEIDPA
jgi:hypothetical protein